MQRQRRRGLRTCCCCRRAHQHRQRACCKARPMTARQRAVCCARWAGARSRGRRRGSGCTCCVGGWLASRSLRRASSLRRGCARSPPSPLLAPPPSAPLPARAPAPAPTAALAPASLSPARTPPAPAASIRPAPSLIGLCHFPSPTLGVLFSVSFSCSRGQQQQQQQYDHHHHHRRHQCHHHHPAQRPLTLRDLKYSPLRAEQAADVGRGWTGVDVEGGEGR